MVNEKIFTKEVIDTDLWHSVKIKENNEELTIDEVIDRLNGFLNENKILKAEIFLILTEEFAYDDDEADNYIEKIIRRGY